MKVDFRWFENYVIFLSIFVASSLSTKSKSVNLALETSFLFDADDIYKNGSFLNIVRNILNNLQSKWPPKNTRFRTDNENSVFTDFITELGVIFIRFDDDEVRKLAQDLNNFVQNKADAGEEFDKVFGGEKIKHLMKSIFKVGEITNPMELKLEAAKYVTNNADTPLGIFFRSLNKHFSENDGGIFKKLIKKFKRARKVQDYTTFLRKIMRFVVFKRFKRLDPGSKQKFVVELRKLADYLETIFKNVSGAYYSRRHSNATKENALSNILTKDEIITNSITEMSFK